MKTSAFTTYIQILKSREDLSKYKGPEEPDPHVSLYDP